MKSVALPSSFALLLALALIARPAADPYPSLASEVLATYAPERGEPAAAAAAFLASLGDELRSRCALPLDSDERRRWTNVPPRPVENGVRLGDLDRAQLERACDLLASALSAQGWTKTRDVVLADDRLLPGGEPRPGFGAENFWLVLFGAPAPDERWALQLDGHHLALNLTFDAGRVALSPSFFGAQPSAYERGGERIEPLAIETDAAYALLASLDEEQRAAALVSPRRGQMVAGAGRDGIVPEPEGLDCATLDDAQRERLRALLHAFVGDLPEARAAARLEALEAEIERMRFAWRGPTSADGDVSWRLQGPSVLLEYACQDLGGNPLDHLHSIYRDPTNEYGSGWGERREL